MYEENAVLHALCTRRSVRSYDSTKPVEQEKIQAVLTAGQYAPTGLSTNRLKGVHILDHYVSMEEYNANRDAR